MTTFLTAAKIAENQAWSKRICLMALDAAVDIMSEDPATAEHAARVALASAVIRGDRTALDALPKIVLANESVRAAAVAGPDLTGEVVPDGDIQFTLASIWTLSAKSLLNL